MQGLRPGPLAEAVHQVGGDPGVHTSHREEHTAAALLPARHAHLHEEERQRHLLTGRLPGCCVAGTVDSIIRLSRRH